MSVTKCGGGRVWVALRAELVRRSAGVHIWEPDAGMK